MCVCDLFRVISIILILFAFRLQLQIAKILWPRGSRRVLSAHLLCLRIVRTLPPHIAIPHSSIKYVDIYIWKVFTLAWFWGFWGCWKRPLR